MASGIIYKKTNKWLTKWFGKSWKNSLWGVLAILPQVAKPIMDYLASVQVPSAVMNGVSLFFGLVFVMTTKGHNVTGEGK